MRIIEEGYFRISRFNYKTLLDFRERLKISIDRKLKLIDKNFLKRGYVILLIENQHRLFVFDLKEWIRFNESQY